MTDTDPDNTHTPAACTDCGRTDRFLYRHEDDLYCRVCRPPEFDS